MPLKASAATATGTRSSGNLKTSMQTENSYRKPTQPTRLVVIESRNDEGHVVGTETTWIPLGHAVNRALATAMRARREA